MAKRRMFNLAVVENDAFLSLPPTAQNLYFHLGMRADDDGFINSVNTVARLASASNEDIALLVEKRFLLAFDGGIYAIKHWRLNNLIRRDRHTPTRYQKELLSLEKGASLPANGNHSPKKPQQPGGKPQQNTAKFVPPTVEEVKAYCADKGYKVDAEDFVNFYDSKGWMVGKNKMQKWRASVALWNNSNRRQKPAPAKKGLKNFEERTYDAQLLEHLENM